MLVHVFLGRGPGPFHFNLLLPWRPLPPRPPGTLLPCRARRFDVIADLFQSLLCRGPPRLGLADWVGWWVGGYEDGPTGRTLLGLTPAATVLGACCRSLFKRVSGEVSQNIFLFYGGSSLARESIRFCAQSVAVRPKRSRRRLSNSVWSFSLWMESDRQPRLRVLLALAFKLATIQRPTHLCLESLAARQHPAVCRWSSVAFLS